MRTAATPVYKDLWAWAFAVSVSGYPLAAIASTLVADDTGNISMAYRALALILCALAALQGRMAAIGSVSLLLLLFPTVYLVRLILDFINDSAGATNLIFALTTCMIPAFFLATASNRWSERNVAWAVFYVGSASVLGVLWLYSSGLTTTFAEQSGRLAFDRLNPISIGHAAVSLLIAAFVVVRVERSALPSLISIGAAGAALTVLYMSASRGPLITLAVCCVVAVPLALRNFGWFIGVLPVLAMVALATAYFDLTPILETLRLIDLAGGTGGLRLDVIGLATDLFFANPWFGYGVRLPFFIEYPHNLLVEVLSSTGIIGGGAFALLFLSTGHAIHVFAAQRLMLLPLLAIQGFVGAQFSGSLWGLSLLWVVVAVIICRANSRLLNPPARNVVPFGVESSIRAKRNRRSRIGGRE